MEEAESAQKEEDAKEEVKAGVKKAAAESSDEEEEQPSEAELKLWKTIEDLLKEHYLTAF